MKEPAKLFGFVLIVILSFTAVGEGQVVPIRIAYATTSGIRLPLWIAEEAKLYEKYKSRRQTDQYSFGQYRDQRVGER